MRKFIQIVEKLHFTNGDLARRIVKHAGYLYYRFVSISHLSRYLRGKYLGLESGLAELRRVNEELI